MKVKLLSIFFFTLFTCLYAQNDLWQKVSHVDAGNSVSMAVDSMGYVYNATSDEGLFQSTDHGQTWKKLETGFYNATFKKVRVIAGGSIAALSADYGILLSDDHGKTWHQRNGSIKAQDILSLTSTSGYLFAGTSNGLFKSSDGGKNWMADNGFSGMKIIETEYLSGVLFCFSRTDAQYFFSNSTDGGNSWIKSSIPYQGFDYNNASFAYIPAAGKVFCALSSEPAQNSYRAYYFSSNNGETWSSFNPGRYINSWIADNSGNLYGACFKSGVIKSTDLGVTWQNASSGISSPFVQSITFDPKGAIYAGTTGGAITSTDNGATWKSYTTGLNNTFVNGLEVDPNGNLYVSTGKCFYWSKDEGSKWQAVTDGLDMLSLSKLRQVKNNIFIYSEEYYGISIVQRDSYKFNPALNKWDKANVYVDEVATDKNADIYSLFQSYSRGWSNYFSVSSDNGNTWTNHNMNLDGKASFTIDPKGTFFFAVALGGGVKKSYNKGYTLEPTGYSENAAIKIRSNSKGFLFFLADNKRMLLSKDEGNSWASITSNLPDVTISDFYIDSKDHVFIIDNTGQVYYSANDGNIWTSITNNLAGKSIVYITFGPDSDVYAATATGEVYKATEALLSMFVSVEKPKDVPGEYSLEQNYPNPFNPKITISYIIPQAGHVNLSIYDAMGRKVMELVDEYKSEGIYKVDFDGKNFTSGVYFYRISSGSYTDTKKLMLLK